MVKINKNIFFPHFYIIVAMDKKQGIGRNGALPWRLPLDLKHFREMTTHTQSKGKKNVVIMGRKTWESIPNRFRPLPDRVNFVLTRQKKYPLPKGVYAFSSLKTAFTELKKNKMRQNIEAIFCVGGGEVFRQAFMYSSFIQKLFVTHIQKDFDCDTHFPDFKQRFKKETQSKIFCKNSTHFYFAQYVRKI